MGWGGLAGAPSLTAGKSASLGTGSVGEVSGWGWGGRLAPGRGFSGLFCALQLFRNVTLAHDLARLGVVGDRCEGLSSLQGH